MADKLQPLLQLRAGGDQPRADSLHADQHQRAQHQRQAKAERRQIALGQRRFVLFRRHWPVDEAADKAAVQRAGDQHADHRRRQADGDHPAEVGLHLRRQQHRHRPRQQEGRGGGYAGEQRDGQLDDIAVGAARHGEHDADQQHHRHVEEQRQRADQAGDAERVVRLALSESFQQLRRNLIERADLMQDLAEHRPERHHDRQEAQRVAHAFLHGVGDVFQRHAGENAGGDGHQHQRDEGVHARLHHQE